MSKDNQFGGHSAAAVEPLESRTLMAGTPFSFLVTDTSDSPSDPGSLRYAVNRANRSSHATTIRFSPTMFPADSHTMIVLSSTLAFTNAGHMVRLIGPGDGGVVISAGSVASASSVASTGPFTFSAITIAARVHAAFSGINVTGGVLSPDTNPQQTPVSVSMGGAIQNAGNLKLTNDVIRNNSAGSGGGIYSTGPLMITSCQFGQNVSSLGAGSAILAQCPVTITGSTFSDKGTLADVVIEDPLKRHVDRVVYSTFNDVFPIANDSTKGDKVTVKGSTFSTSQQGALAGLTLLQGNTYLPIAK